MSSANFTFAVEDGGLGIIEKDDVNYTTARNASIGEDIYRDFLDICNYYPDYYILRGLLPIDTRLTNSNRNISSGYLRIYFESCGYVIPNDELCIVNTEQADVDIVALADYGRFNETIGGSINISTNIVGAWQNISLNTTGLSWINQTSDTKLGLRTLSDINSTSPTGTGATQRTYVELNQNLTTSPPSLHIEYNDVRIPNIDLNTNFEDIKELELSESLEVPKLLLFTNTLNLDKLDEQFEYTFAETINETAIVIASKEADFAIGDEHLPTPPKFKLLGYTVINEFGSPYITADLKFQGNDIPSKDEYITLTQTDAETGQKKIIFRGFPIEVSWKLKKDLVESSIKAVTNGWYLTQQNPSEWECSTPQVWKVSQTWDPDYVYGRMNEIMLMWDYMNRIPSQWDVEGGLTTFPMRPTGFCSWYSNWCAKKMDTRWNLLTGVAPSHELTEEVFNLVNIYLHVGITPSNYVDIPDCKGITDEPKEWAFDDFRTTKHDAIIQFSDYCDRIFHTRIAQNDINMTKYQPPYGSYDKGTLVAYWTRNTSAIANSIEPFSVCLNITALTDNTLIEINKEERDTERTTPNVVKAGSIEPESYYTNDYERNESTYPCDWWQKSTGEYTECGSYWFRAERPIEHFRMTENLSQNQVETYAQEMYERLQKGQDKYTASCLSIVCERASPHRSILPGSRIRVQNVSNHTDDELRIMRITHKKDGPKPATTEIEYYDVYDLAHPNIFPGSNIIERITAQSEKNAEMGPRIETYQNIKNPRKVGVGSQSFITPVEVTNVSSDLKVAEVRILNTSGKVKNVITW